MNKQILEKINLAIEKTLLPPDYKPTEKEEFMSQLQLGYFRNKLLLWKKNLILESYETIDKLQSDSLVSADLNDRASLESEQVFELRTRDRYRKLIAKIDQAIDRINEGEYGYCKETGEKIPLARLEVRPTATMTIEAQEAYERTEQGRKDDRN